MTGARALAALALFSAPAAMAQTAPTTTVTVQASQPGATINRDIFGQFAEHLGTGIYGGIWVGRDSAIPNVRGIRASAPRRRGRPRSMPAGAA